MAGVLKNSSSRDLHVWDGRAYGLEVFCGPRKRVNEYLEEIDFARKAVKKILPGTACVFADQAAEIQRQTQARYPFARDVYNTNFSFQQTVQATDADGASLTSSTTETALATTVSFLGSGSGTLTGGFWSAQKTIIVDFWGALSSAASTPGNFNLNLRQDSTAGTSAGAQAAYALATSLATSPMACRAVLVCRADGTAGNVEAAVEYTPGATPSSGTNVRQIARANIGSFDTTANHSFLVTGLFSASSASNIALAKIFIVEVLN